MDGGIQQSSLLEAGSPGSDDAGCADQQQVADAFAPLRALLQSEGSDEDVQLADAPHASGDASHDELDWYRGGVGDSPDSEANAPAPADTPLPVTPALAPQPDVQMALKEQSNGAIKKVKKDRKEKKPKKSGDKGEKKERKQKKVEADTPTPCLSPAPAKLAPADSSQDAHKQVSAHVPVQNQVQTDIPTPCLLQVPVAPVPATTEAPAASATGVETNGVEKRPKKEKKGDKAGKKEKKEKKIKKAASNLQEDCKSANAKHILEMQKEKAKLWFAQKRAKSASVEGTPCDATPDGLKAVQSSEQAQLGANLGSCVASEDCSGGAVVEGMRHDALGRSAEATQSSQVEDEGTAAEDELVFAGGLLNVPVPLEASAEAMLVEAAELAEPTEAFEATPAQEAAEMDLQEAEPSELIFAGGLSNVPLPDDLLTAASGPATYGAPGDVAAATDAAPEVIDIDSDDSLTEDSPTAEDASALFEALAGTSASGPVVEVLKTAAGRGSRSAAAKLVPDIDPTSSAETSVQERGVLGNASMLDDFASPLDNYVNEEPPAGQGSQPTDASPAEPGDVVGNASMLDDYDTLENRGDESPVTPHEEAAAAMMQQPPPEDVAAQLSGALQAMTAAPPPPQSSSVMPHSKSCLRAKTAALATTLGPLLQQQQQSTQPLLLPPPPLPPMTPPPALALLQPALAAPHQPILGAAPTKAAALAAPAALPKSGKFVTAGSPLVAAGGMPSASGLPGALAKNIRMPGPAPKMAVTAVTHLSPAATLNAHAMLPPVTVASTDSGDLPLQISIGSAPAGMSSPAQLHTSPVDASSAAAEPMHISIGTSPETLTAASSTGEGFVEVADEANEEIADEVDEEEPEGSALLEVLQSILPSPEDEMLESQGEMQEA